MDILKSLYNSPNVPKSNIFSLTDLVAVVLNVVLGIGFSVAIISLAYSGIMYATSSGDPKNTKKAWDAFLWAVIAAAVTLLSFAIRRVILVGVIGTSPGYGNNVPTL